MVIENLLKLIEAQGGSWTQNKNYGRPCNPDEIIVSVAEFFDGANNDRDSLIFAANTGIDNEDFYRIFREIKQKDHVQDVWIQIYDYDPEESEWPYAEVCYIATTATKEEVPGWFGHDASPSEIHAVNVTKEKPKYLPNIEPGNVLFCCWWD